MAQQRARVVYDGHSSKIVGWVVECPACGKTHCFDWSRFTFDGDLSRPTFSPALKVSEGGVLTCHLQVVNGMAYFHTDSPHDYAGKSFTLPELPADPDPPPGCP